MTWPSQSTWSCSAEQVGTQPVSPPLLVLDSSSVVPVEVPAPLEVVESSASVLALELPSVSGTTAWVLLPVSMVVGAPEVESSPVGVPEVVLITSLAALLETSGSCAVSPAG